jgi:aspartokinase
MLNKIPNNKIKIAHFYNDCLSKYKYFQIPAQIPHTINSFWLYTILVNNEEEIMERRLITGISNSKNDVRITLHGMPDHPGLSAIIFGALSEAEVNVDMIVQNISSDSKTIDITFTTEKTVKIQSNKTTSINL